MQQTIDALKRDVKLKGKKVAMYVAVVLLQVEITKIGVLFPLVEIGFPTLSISALCM